MSSCRRIVFSCVLLVGPLTGRALAQQSSDPTKADTVPQTAPAGPGEYKRWSVRATFGSARIHSWDDRTSWMEFRVGRTIGSRITSIDVGIGGAGSGAPFTSLTSGLELRPWPDSRFSPFVRGEVGMLGEGDFAGVVAGTGGGLILRLGSRVGLRTGAALNFHGSEKGPVTFGGGLEYRW